MSRVAYLVGIAVVLIGAQRGKSYEWTLGCSPRGADTAVRAEPCNQITKIRAASS